MSQAIIIATTTGASTTSYAIRPLDSIASQLNPDGTAASFASLAASVITLAAGTYRIRARAKATGAAADSVGIRLYNITDAIAVTGTEDAQHIAVLNENVDLFFSCGFVQAGSKTYRIEGRGTAASANGFGIAIGGFSIPYAVIEILKTA